MIRPIGTGPYRLDNVSIEEKYINLSFTRFNNHFRGLAPFVKIECLYYPTLADYNFAIMNQEGELAERYFDPTMIDRDYWTIDSRSEVMGTLVGHFNAQREELRDPLVRAALNYALDREGLIDEIFGQNNRGFIDFDLQPAKTVLSQTSVENKSNFGYSYNPKLADELLTLAGYPKNAEGNRLNLSITMLPFHSHVQEWLSSAFNSLGISCIFDTADIDSGPPTSLNRSTDIFLFAIGGTVYYDLLHSNGLRNIGGYSNEYMDLLTYLEMQTPVSQEKEFYEKLILELSQEQAPCLILYNEQVGYIKAKSIASLINLSLHGQYLFNYSTLGGTGLKFSVKQPTEEAFLDIQSRSMENIIIEDKALYFPFTDNILRSAQELVVSTQQSTNLHSFLPGFNLQGKFFKVEVSNQNVDYHLRCYYDPEDIRTIPTDQTTLYRWISESWKELDPYSTNSSLRYVEVIIRGDVIVRFGPISATFQFLPLVSVFILCMITIISITLVYNQKNTKYLLRRYEG